MLTTFRENSYFEKINPALPMLNKERYLAACNAAPHGGPPICLRYAIWAVAATVEDPYMKYMDVFYQRARMYAEMDELKVSSSLLISLFYVLTPQQGQGQHFVTVQHAQCWTIICDYEVRNVAFPRAWMSSGRASRLVQMMGLDRLDTDNFASKQTIRPAKNWTELEERRRTFWMAYCGDRWSSSGTGWAMMFNEQDVCRPIDFIDFSILTV